MSVPIIQVLWPSPSATAEEWHDCHGFGAVWHPREWQDMRVVTNSFPPVWEPCQAPGRELIVCLAHPTWAGNVFLRLNAKYDLELFSSAGTSGTAASPGCSPHLRLFFLTSTWEVRADKNWFIGLFIISITLLLCLEIAPPMEKHSSALQNQQFKRI